MTIPDEHPLPGWTWRLLGACAVGLLLTAVLIIALISAGVFDPQPAGPLQSTLAPGEHDVAALARDVIWQPYSLPSVPFTARLTAEHVSGETDVGYGLALGNGARTFVVAVSPLGYVTVWEGVPNSGAPIEYVPWQTWPHVRTTEGTINELQVDVTDDHATVRVNRERLWQGKLGVAPQSAGIFAESFGQSATIDFQDLTLYFEPGP